MSQAFTERPSRNATLVPTALLVDQRFWSPGGNPNGALTFELNGTLCEVAVDILNATARGSARYTLNVTALDPGSSINAILEQQNGFASSVDEDVTLGAVSLFIDGNSLQCGIYEEQCEKFFKFVSVPAGSTVDITPYSLNAIVEPPGGYYTVPWQGPGYLRPEGFQTAIQSGTYSTDSCPCGLCPVQEGSQVGCLNHVCSHKFIFVACSFNF
jgi:hypothetical protein